MERLAFSDLSLAFDLGGHAGTTARILGAVFGPASVGNAVYAGIGLKLLGEGMSTEALMQLALEQLGLGPCHHMFEVRDNPRQVRDWEDAAAGKAVDWRRVFRDYRSQVDWPGARQ